MNDKIEYYDLSDTDDTLTQLGKLLSNVVFFDDKLRKAQLELDNFVKEHQND